MFTGELVDNSIILKIMNEVIIKMHFFIVKSLNPDFVLN